MLAYFLTPPGLYYLIGTTVIFSLIIYWQRKPIMRELRRWRGKELVVGPLTLERKEHTRETKQSGSATGVDFGQGSDFTRAKIKNVAGRDIKSSDSKSSRGGAIPGVNFGKNSKFIDSEIEDIAGRDLSNKEEE